MSASHLRLVRIETIPSYTDPFEMKLTAISRDWLLVLCMLALHGCDGRDASHKTPRNSRGTDRTSEEMASPIKSKRTERVHGLDSEVAALNAIAKTGDWKDRKQVAEMWRRIAEQSPSAALEMISEMHPLFLSILWVEDSDVLQRLVSEHYAEVESWLHSTIPVSNHVLSFRSKLIAKMNEVAPSKAMQLLEGLSKAEMAANLTGALWSLASCDPDGALRQARLQLTGSELGTALKGIACSIARTDPQRAFDLAKSFDSMNANASLPGVFQVWFTKDAKSAVAAMGMLQPSVIADILADKRNLDNLGKADAGSLAEAMRNVPYTEANSKLYTDAGQALVRRRPDEVPGWLAELPASSRRNELVMGMFAQLYEQDPNTAQDLATALPSDLQSGAMRGIVRKMSAVDYDSAMKIAQSQEGSIGDDLFREIGRAMALVNPAKAVAMIEDRSVEARIGLDFRKDMISHTVQTWSWRDLSAAQQWVENLEPADAPMGVQGLMTSWMKTDPVAASEWLSKQPLGPARDAGARVVIEQIKDTDPERAEVWRKAMSSPEAK